MARSAPDPTTLQRPYFTRLARLSSKCISESSMGMPPRLLPILAALRHLGPTPQSLFVDNMDVSQNTVVLWLNELEDLRYVTRLRDPGDRRRHIVTLTDTGLCALQQAEGVVAQFEDNLMSVLSDADQDQLKDLLGQVLDAALTARGHAPARADSPVS